MFHRSIYL